MCCARPTSWGHRGGRPGEPGEVPDDRQAPAGERHRGRAERGRLALGTASAALQKSLAHGGGASLSERWRRLAAAAPAQVAASFALPLGLARALARWPWPLPSPGLGPPEAVACGCIDLAPVSVLRVLLCARGWHRPSCGWAEHRDERPAVAEPLWPTRPGGRPSTPSEPTPPSLALPRRGHSARLASCSPRRLPPRSQRFRPRPRPRRRPSLPVSSRHSTPSPPSSSPPPSTGAGRRVAPGDGDGLVGAPGGVGQARPVRLLAPTPRPIPAAQGQHGPAPAGGVVRDPSARAPQGLGFFLEASKTRTSSRRDRSYRAGVSWSSSGHRYLGSGARPRWAARSVRQVSCKFGHSFPLPSKRFWSATLVLYPGDLDSF